MTQQAMKSLFCRISKVDEEKRTVTGIGASEAVDADGEVFDYAGSKPYVEAWSDSAQRRSQGKSYGNIREMHQLSAAGKLSEPIIFDDDQKLVILTSYVSDDDAWQKCLDGTYTGFSISGPVVGDKWSDAGTPGVKRYVCAPIEFSLVDLPCNPDAVFTAVKAGGITEQRNFKFAAPAAKEGNVAQDVNKSIYDIGDLASVINSLKWTQDGLVYEREAEGDDSPVPDKLKSIVADLCAVLVDLAREETSELVTAMKTAGAKKMVAKAKTDSLDAISKCMKALNDMGDCVTGKCDHGGIEECAKAIGAAHKKATKAMSLWADPDDDADADGAGDGKDSQDDESSKKAAEAAPQSQGASPENGDDEMDEAMKAQLATAEKNSAEALEISKANATGLQQVADALGKLTSLIAGEAVPAKSVGPAAVAAVSKASEAAGKTETVADSPEAVAKSILSNPRPVSANEISALRIGR